MCKVQYDAGNFLIRQLPIKTVKIKCCLIASSLCRERKLQLGPFIGVLGGGHDAAYIGHANKGVRCRRRGVA